MLHLKDSFYILRFPGPSGGATVILTAPIMLDTKLENKRALTHTDAGAGWNGTGAFEVRVGIAVAGLLEVLYESR
jgi:hypothetical protein